ncbi:MAG: Ig-like domain-containing protein [Verrucomicrobiota bacterium]
MKFAPLLVLALSSNAAWAVPAFPGAEGFGANAKGARVSGSPTVYHVTNLNDSGAGSFRDAVSASNRVVVFDLGGIIRINSPVVVAANLTIAGQTAPGGGITVYGNRISFSGADNTICRYIRFRMGIDGDDGADAMGLADGNDLIFDHISTSWGRDETFSISGDTAIRITLQDCLIAQGLRIHSAGGLMQTSGGVSIFRTLYADNWMRNPKVKGVNDYINNVVYNWGGGGGYIPAGDSAGDSYTNVIGNYFIGGPETGAGTSPFKTGNANYRIYHSGNFQDLDLDGVLDGTAVTNSSFPTLTIVPSRYAYPAPTTSLSAQEALGWILDHSGVSHKRDRTDNYVLDEVRSYGTAGAFIYNESDMGGIGSVASGLKVPDADNDGMPDWWEQAAGTNPADPADATVLGADGYLNIERYINALVIGGVPGATLDGITTDTGSSATDGITSDPTLILRGTAKAGASVAVSRADTGLLGTVNALGDGTWSFDHSGTVLSDRTYAFFATATISGTVTPQSPAFVLRVDTVAAAAPSISSIAVTPNFAINGTSVPGDVLNVFLNNSVVATATADELGNWSAPYLGTPPVPGAYSFTAKASDLAGNPGPASAVYLVDTSRTAPAFTGISTDSGNSSSDRLTNDTTLTLSGTATASSTVSVTRYGVGVIGTTTATAGGTFSFDYTGTILPGGVHTFVATASTSGTAGPASTPFVVTLDTTVPVISSIRRFNPAIYSTNGGTVVFRVTFAEAVTGVGLADFGLTTSGAMGTLSSMSTVSTSVYDVTVTSVSGNGTIRADLDASGTGIADLAGNAISGAYTSGQTYTVRPAGSGVWISTDNNDLWGDATNWNVNAVASGSGTTADFGLCDLLADTSLRLDSSRTLGRLVFGDTDYSTPAGWTIDDGGDSSHFITLTGGTPAIQVDGEATPAGDTIDVPAAADYPHHLAVTLSGNAGFTKTGVGTIELNRANPGLNGALTISKGVVQIGPGGTLSPSSVTIATSQQLRVAGGTFSTAGNVSWTSGTGTGVIVSGGSASFQNILSTNTRNSFFKVTGGTVTAKDLNFPRSGDSESQTVGTGVLISGGETTFANIGLGTDNSWAGMTVSGGKLTVTGTLHNGYQVTAGRGGVIYLSGGELAVPDTTTGLIMSRNPGSNPNNVSKLLITGGVANLGRLALGYDATSSAGSATVSITNGELCLGTGGIVKSGTSGLATSITLNNGTLGTLANWTTTHPIILAGPAVLRAGANHGMTLGGDLSGTSGVTKTGDGIVTLAAANSFSGEVNVNAGILNLTGSLATGGTLTVNNGGKLTGNGTTQKPLALTSGGVVSPTGTLTASSTQWNAGGRMEVNLTGDKLAISGSFTQSGVGPFAFDFIPGTLTVGTPRTLVTFGSSNFTVANFSHSGLGYATGHFTLMANSLTFTLDNDGSAIAPFYDWLASHGLTPAHASAGVDSDGDGTANLLEFVFDTDPFVAGPAPVEIITAIANQVSYPAVRFTRLQARGGVVVTVQVSENLTFSPADATIEVSATPQGDGTEVVVARSPLAMTQASRQFFRVQATLP